MTGVSDDLLMIADWIGACALRGKPIDPAASAQLARVLLKLSVRAAATERLPIILACDVVDAE